MSRNRKLRRQVPSEQPLADSIPPEQIEKVRDELAVAALRDHVTVTPLSEETIPVVHLEWCSWRHWDKLAQKMAAEGYRFVLAILEERHVADGRSMGYASFWEKESS